MLHPQCCADTAEAFCQHILSLSWGSGVSKGQATGRHSCHKDKSPNDKLSPYPSCILSREHVQQRPFSYRGTWGRGKEMLCCNMSLETQKRAFHPDPKAKTTELSLKNTMDGTHVDDKDTNKREISSNYICITRHEPVLATRTSSAWCRRTRVSETKPNF